MASSETRSESAFNQIIDDASLLELARELEDQYHQGIDRLLRELQARTELEIPERLPNASRRAPLRRGPPRRGSQNLSFETD